jgi:hypothetical protein
MENFLVARSGRCIVGVVGMILQGTVAVGHSLRFFGRGSFLSQDRKIPLKPEKARSGDAKASSGDYRLTAGALKDLVAEGEKPQEG